MKACKSLYSIYNGRSEASEKTKANKINFDYVCEDTKENRSILLQYSFPKYARNNKLYF